MEWLTIKTSRRECKIDWILNIIALVVINNDDNDDVDGAVGAVGDATMKIQFIHHLSIATKAHICPLAL